MSCNRYVSRLILCSLSLTIGLGCQDDLSLCSIAQSDCQEQIYSHLLSVRGDGYDPYNGKPPVTVISEDQFRQALLDEPRTVNPWDKALTLLHFQSGSRETDVEDEVANILAYYSWGSKTVTIISHPSQTGRDAEEEAMVTLAHEFVHSLQDHELDLGNSNFETTDAYFAYDTIIEGDARFYELLFMSDLLNLGYSRDNILGVVDQYLDNTYTYLSEYGSSLFGAQALTYFLGAHYEAVEYRSGGNAAIRHGYSKAPTRMLGYLGGSTISSTFAGGCTAPETSLSADSANSTDEFGALLFYTFMRGLGVTHQTALLTAQSWTGDSVRMQYTSDFTTTAVAWRIQLSAPPASEVTRAITATGDLTVDVTGNRILITASDATLPLTWTPAANCP